MSQDTLPPITLEEVLRLCSIPDATIKKNLENLRILQPKFDELIASRAVQAEPVTAPSKIGRLAEILNSDGTENGIIAALLNNDWKRDTMLLMPSGGTMSARVVFATSALLRQHRNCGFVNICDTLVQRARNLCVDEFLRTEAEWSLWIDSDVVVPFGIPGYFYKELAVAKADFPPEFARLNTITRLKSHGKKIVGGVYRQRRDNARLVIQPHLNSRGAADDELVRQLENNGPLDKLVEVDYVATGCALVHRDVYKAIIANNPDRQRDGVPFDFFGHDMSVSGEDIAFCKLAKEAGHRSYLDCGLWCAHLGNMAFMPSKR